MGAVNSLEARGFESWESEGDGDETGDSFKVPPLEENIVFAGLFSEVGMRDSARGIIFASFSLASLSLPVRRSISKARS